MIFPSNGTIPRPHAYHGISPNPCRNPHLLSAVTTECIGTIPPLSLNPIPFLMCRRLPSPGTIRTISTRRLRAATFLTLLQLSAPRLHALHPQDEISSAILETARMELTFCSILQIHQHQQTLAGRDIWLIFFHQHHQRSMPHCHL